MNLRSPSITGQRQPAVFGFVHCNGCRGSAQIASPGPQPATKFADLLDRKQLIQLSLVVFVLGSALAGFSQNTGTLTSFRVLQGHGAGGLAALSQILMADIISPRDRGRCAGLHRLAALVAQLNTP